MFKFFALPVVTEETFGSVTSTADCFSSLPVWFKHNQARKRKLITHIGNIHIVENYCLGNVNQPILLIYLIFIITLNQLIMRSETLSGVTAILAIH